MNWESLHPDEKTVDLEDADRIAAFARMHDRKIHWSQFGLGNPQSRMAHVGQFHIAKTFFRRRGVPIHGIGFPMHIYNLAPNLASIAANFARCGKLRIQIHITEMDVAFACDRNGGCIGPRRSSTPRWDLWPNCQNLFTNSQLHGNRDLGRNWQILLARVGYA